MFLRAALAALALATPASSAVANNGMPPERFRGNVASIVIFTDRAGIDEMCGVAPVGQIIACARRLRDGTPIIVMPNPCVIGDKELYARIMCHENGHINGWGPDHED